MNGIAALQVLAAYLCGSIPFAYLAGRLLKGIDIRQHGSGNVGATNVLRVLGKGPGVAVLCLDMAKGTLASTLLPRLGAGSGAAAFLSEDWVSQSWWPCVLGLVAVLGHSYTVFLRFKGGKGVASSAGAFLGLAPWATLVVFAVFGVVLYFSRMVSLGSLAGATALPALVAAWGEWRPAAAKASINDAFRDGWSLSDRPVFYLALAVAALIWVKHSPNIRRILAGTESRIA